MGMGEREREECAKGVHSVCWGKDVCLSVCGGSCGRE